MVVDASEINEAIFSTVRELGGVKATIALMHKLLRL